MKRLALPTLALLATAITAPVHAAEPGLEGRTDVMLQDGFETSDWYTAWGRNDAPQNTSIVADAEALSGDSVLRVAVQAGGNYGTSFGFDFADAVGVEPEEAYFRYAIRLGPTWTAEVGGGKLPGWGGTYGQAGWGGRPADGTNGWSARGLFWTPDSNATSGDTRVGFYVYHADMMGIYGSNWFWSGGAIGNEGVMVRNVWYQVEVHAKMNTPGLNDGVLSAWIDGMQVFERTDVRMRDVDTLRIERAWFDIYYGGNWVAPVDMYIDFDNAVVAYDPIGVFSPLPPMMGTGGGPPGAGGANGAGGSTASATGSGGSGGSDPAALAATSDESGCACSAVGGSGGTTPAWPLLALLAIPWRRRGRRSRG